MSKYRESEMPSNQFSKFLETEDTMAPWAVQFTLSLALNDWTFPNVLGKECLKEKTN